MVWTGSDSSLCEHTRPRTKAAEGWLTVLISSHRTAPGGFQTELEEGKESSVKEKDFRTSEVFSGELTTENEVMDKYSALTMMGAGGTFRSS